MAARTRARALVPATLAAAMLSSETALADAIDGDWCYSDGKRLSINGPEIVTPGGVQTKGNYDRHHFSYVVPATEPGASLTVTMVLLSEIMMRLKPPGGEEQTWRRCGKPIS